MKNVRLQFALILSLLVSAGVPAFAAKVFTPVTANSMSANKTYCQGATATRIVFNYGTCNSGSGGNTGVSMTVNWYSNTVNSTSGGTLVFTETRNCRTRSTGAVRYTPSTTTPGELYYYAVITWSGSGTCNTAGTLTSPSATKITVSETPAAISGSNSVCVGSTTTFTNTASGGTWSSSNTARATVGLTTGIVTGVASGTAIITYRVSCGTRVTKTISVNATPTVATISGSTANICAGSTLSLSNATSGGTWSSSNSSVATVNTSGVVSGVTNGTATISYEVSNGCGTGYATRDVSVTTSPSAISGFSSTCTGYTLFYTNTAPYGTWSSSNASRATVDAATGEVDALTAGTVNISYTTGCGSAVGTTLTVNAGPAAITGTAAVCSGSTSTLSNSVSGGTWTSSNAAVATIGSATGILTGVGAGTSRISYATGSSCAAVITATVKVTPASISGANAICTGTTSTYTNTTLYGTWSSSNTSVATIGSSTGIVTGVAQGTARLTYTTGCGTAATKVITVNAQPGSITGTASVCVGATTTLANSVSGGVWTSENTSIATINSSGVVTGVLEGSIDITYTNGVCYATRELTVNPLADAGTISGDLAVCDGDETDLASDGDAGGSWTTSSSSVASVDGTGTVTGNSVGTARISYSVSNSCGTQRTTVVVTVNEAPNAGSISGASTVCQSATTTFTTSGTGGAWSSSNTAVASVGTSGVVSGVAGGNATISYTATNGCGTDVDTKDVTVNPLPSVTSITGTLVVCQSATTVLSNATSGGAWSSSNTSVATVGTGGVVSGVAAGISTISYGVTNSCGTSYATAVVTVNPLANAGTITGTASMCAGANTTLSNAVSGGVWTSSNTSVATVSAGVVTGVAAGNATISYAVTNGCGTQYATQAVTVNANPASITGTTTFCQLTTSTLSSATGGGTWSSSNTAVATAGSSTGVVTGVAGGTATISYILSTGCRATTSVSVTAAPVVTVPSDMTVCNGATVPAQTFSSSISGTGYSWTNSNTSIGLVASNSGSMCGTASENGTLVMTAPTGAVFTGVTFASYGTPTGSCGSFATSSCHAVNSASIVSSYLVGNATASIPARNSVFTDPCTGTLKRLYVQATYSYTVVPSFTATNPGATPLVGTINVTPVANGCTGNSNSFTITIDNTAAPVAYNMTGGGSYCSDGTGVAVGLSNSTVGINYQLMKDGANIGSPVAGTGSAISFGLQTGAGAYTAQGTNTSTGCVNTMSGSVTVSINPTPTVTVPSNQVVANGAVQPALSLTGSLSGSVYAWTVDNSIGLSDGTTGTVCGTVNEGGSLTLTAPAGTVFTSIDFASYGTPTGSCGSFAQGGCHATNSATIVAGYLVGNNSATIPATNAVFTDPCVGTGKRLYVQASYGVIPSFTAVNSGSSPVVATVTVTPTKNGCAGTPGTFTITVDPSVATYNVTGGGSYCGTGAGVDVGLDGSQTGVNYQLKVGSTNIGSAVAGTGSALSFGTFTVTGTYSVQATTIAAGTTAAMSGSAMISTGSTSSITGTLTVCEAATTALSNATGGGVWTSSNTSIATVNSSTGVVTGVAGGNATITYAVGSCTSTAEVTVNALPSAGTISGTAAVCEAATTSLTSSVGGGAWTTSDASVATVSGGTVSGVASGTATISYAVTTSCGTDYATQVVTVNALPSAGTISGTAVVCEAATTSLSSSVGSGAWTTSDATAATVSGGTVTGVAPGTATISYAVTTSCGTDYATQVVTVNGLPSAGTISGSAVVCVAATTNLSSTVGGGAWTSDNASVATVSGGTVTGVAAGTATISYAVTTSCGTDYTTQSVDVIAIPTVGSIAGSTVICAGSTSDLDNSVSGGVWTSGDASVATVDASGIVSGVAAGTAGITYSNTNSCGTAADMVTVTVNPSSASISGANTLCLGGTTTFSISDAAGTWSSSNTAVATINTSTGVINSVGLGAATITYTAATGCFYSTKALTVNSTVAAVSGVLHACVGYTSTLTNTTGGGTWSSSNPSIASVDAATGVVTAVSAGTATISYTVAGGCYNTGIFISNAMPDAITGTATICTESYSVLYSTTGGAGTWSSSNTSVATINSISGWIDGVSAGNATVTYRIPATGCEVTREVTVNASPAAIAGVTPVCAENTVAFTSATSGGTWTSSQPSVATIDASTGVVSTLIGGGTTITYTLANGCLRTYAMTVNALPSGITSANFNVCLGVGTTLASTTTGGTWSSGNTSVATIGSSNGAVTSQGIGDAAITYTAATGCTRTATVSVYSATAAITGPDMVCKGYSATFTNATSGGTWISSNTSLATINCYTGVLSTGIIGGSVNISYRLTSNGCMAIKPVTVAAINGNLKVCMGSTTELSHAMTGGTWTSSNTARATVDESTGVVTAVSTGTCLVTYFVNPSTYTTATIVVNPIPAAITGASSVCQGSWAVYTGTAGGSGTWSSSDVAVGSIYYTSGMFTAMSEGTVTLTYKIPNTGCFTTREVTVLPAPAEITGSSSVCVGSTTALASSPTGGVWTRSNGLANVNASTGDVTGIGGGGVTITYTAPNGCRRTKAMTVNAIPAGITGSTTISMGGSTTLSCSSSGGAWSSSNCSVANPGTVMGVSGSTSTGVIHGIGTGSATISYTFGNGCARTASVSVVGAKPGDVVVNEDQVQVLNAFKLYPNPTSGTFYVESSVAGKMVVLTIDGKVAGEYELAEGTTSVTLTNNLASGIYMCQFSFNDGTSKAERLYVK